MNSKLKIFLIIISMIFIFNTNTIMVKAETNKNVSIIVEETISNEVHLLEPEELTSCDSLLGNPKADGSNGSKASPAYYMSFAFSVMRYAAIILLIVMTIMDFTSAVAAQDNDVMRKSISKLGKRAVMCVIIFLLPTLIDFVLQFLHQSQVSDCIDLSK